MPGDAVTLAILIKQAIVTGLGFLALATAGFLLLEAGCLLACALFLTGRRE